MANSFLLMSANRYWIAGSSSTWNNTANWSTSSGGASGASVPGSSDIVNFDANGIGICTLDMNATVLAVVMSAGTLNTSTYTFTVNGSNNSTFSGGTINGNNTFNIQPTGSARVTFSGTTFNPAVDVVAPRILLNGSTFNSTSSFEKTYSGNDASIGGNTFVGNCIIKNTGSNYFLLGNGGDDSFSNNLDIINSGSNIIYIAYNNSTTTIGGDLIVTNSGSATTIGISNNSSSSVAVSGSCTVSGNTSVNSTIYLGNNGSFTVSGSLDITNNGTDNSNIYLANSATSSATITGNTVVSNNGANTNKRIYLGNYGDVTFDGTLTITNNSSANNSRIYCNNRENSSNTYNENIILEVTNVDCDGVYFGNLNGVGTLAANKTIIIGGSGYSAGSLYFRNFTQLGGTAQNITLTGTALLYNYDSNWGGNVDFKAPRLNSRGTTYNSNCKFEKNGTNHDNCFGDNIFKGNFEIINTSDSRFRMGDGGTDDFQGDVSITNNGSHEVYIAYHSPGTTTIAGDLTINNVAASDNGSVYVANDSITTMVVSGTTAITNSGAGTTKRVYLGNNGDITFNGNITVSNSSSADNSRVYFNNSSNSNNQYNENIVLEVTNANCDGVYFGNSNGSGTLAASKTMTIGGGGFIAGSLYIRNFTQTGPINHSFTMGSSAVLVCKNSNWGGDITCNSPTMSISNSTFHGSAYIQKTGSSDDNSAGGNTFMGNVTFVNSGSGYLRLGSGTSSDFQADVTINNTGSNDVIFARQGAGHSISGDLSINNSGTGSQVYIADNTNSTLTIGGNTIVANSGDGTNGRVYLGNDGDVTFSGDIDISNSSTASNSMVYIGDNVSNSNIIMKGNLMVENTDPLSDGIDINCNSASLANGKTISIKAGGFIAGVFTIENLTQNGTTAQSLELSSDAYLQLRNNNWGAAVTFIAPRVYLRNSVYNGTAYIEKTGANNDNCYGGNTFKENVEIVNSASAQFIIAYTNPDIYEKNLKLTNSGTNSLYLGNNAAGTQVQGDLVAENKGSAINLFISNNSSATVTIGGATTITNTSSASTSRVYFGNSGDITANGNCSFSNNSSGDIGTISIANSESSAVSITGNVSLTNESAGTTKRVLVGNNGDVVINGSLSVDNSSTASNSQVFCNYNGNSSNQYNGNISVVCNTAGCDGIYFGSNTGTSTLADGYTITAGAAGFSEGTLYLRNFTQNGSTAQNLSLTANAYLSLYSSLWNANISFVAPLIFLRNSTYNGTASFEKTGSANLTSYGGNVFNAATTIENSGTAFFRLANNVANDFNADITFIKSNSGDLIPAYNTQSTVSNNVNIDVNSLFYIGGTNNSWIEFDGTTAQSINNIGAANTIRVRRLMTNNSSADITLNTPIQIINNLNLSNGNIITTATNIIRINNDAVVDAVSDNAYIDGPIVKYGDDAFTFPVGGTDSYGSSHYAGIGISAPLATSHSFTAEYHASGHANASTFLNPLQKVSLVEYWDLDRTNGDSDVDVTLHWGDGTRSGIGNISDLRVSHWDGGSWENMGNEATTGNLSSGSITVNSISSFSPFTMATIDSSTNILPIDLVDFDVAKVGSMAHVYWSTASEIDNEYFIIERTSDFNNIETLGTVKGAGNSNRLLHYSFDDIEPLGQTSYYRLSQVDFDGSKEVFAWKAVSFNQELDHKISVFPNPSTLGNVNICLVNYKGDLSISIVDLRGRVVYSSELNIKQKLRVIPLKLNLESGVYFIRVTDTVNTKSSKFIIK